MKRIIFLLLSLLILASCQRGNDKKAELEKLIKERDKLNEQISKLEKEVEASEGIESKTVNVAVTEIIPVTFRHYIEVQGKVDGDENVAVSAKTAGVVTSINVEEGQTVSKGQLLATLDAQVFYQTLYELESQLNFATDMYNRQKNLWDQQIGSEVQYLSAKNNKEALENKIKTLKEQIAMSRITSPINGTVEEIPIKIGQSLAPGFTAFRVVNFAKIKVVADIAEAYSPVVRSGDSVLVFLPDVNEEISTKLNFTSKYINPVNRTFQVECRLTPDKKYEMRANMIAVLKINDYTTDNAVAIPANIVQKSLTDYFVFVSVMENGKKVARKRIITTGKSYNGLTEIKSGLKQGEMLVTTGYLDLNEGDILNY